MPRIFNNTDATLQFKGVSDLEDFNGSVTEGLAIVEGHSKPQESNPGWKAYEKFVFRLAFIFFSVFSIPWDKGFYEYLYNLDYAKLNYRHLTEIVAFFNPQFVSVFSETVFLDGQVTSTFLLYSLSRYWEPQYGRYLIKTRKPITTYIIG